MNSLNDNTESVILKDVSKIFSNLKAVDKVSFNVDKNEILGLIGPNGAGKTTIIKLIANLIKPDDGKIFICGKSPEQAIKKGNIAFCLDTPALYKNLTVKNNLDFFLSIFPRKNKTLLDLLIKEFQIDSIWNKKVEKLSKGQTQKVALVRTLASDADFFVLDEPFNALDFETRMIFLDMVENLKNNFRKGFLITSHNISFIERICDKVVFIDKGKIVFFGRIDSLDKRLIFKVVFKGDFAKAVSFFSNSNNFELIKKTNDYLLVSGNYYNFIEVSKKINHLSENYGFLISNIIPITGRLETFYVSNLSK